MVLGGAHLRTGRNRLKTDPSALAGDVLVLLPDDLELTALERELLDSLPREKVLLLGVDQSATEPDDGREQLSDAMLLRWSPSPVESPAPKKDGTAEIFRAIGEVNEVREVFRRCLESGESLDNVEVLHTDTETYIPLFYELAWCVQSEAESADRELPVTFAEGVPVRYSRPGRALMAWLTKILDQQIAMDRELCPPPSESVFRAQRRQLEEAAQVFLAGEEEFCQRSCPKYLEASLGMTAIGEPSPLDDAAPILVSLPGGQQFRARGRIDRVDRIGDESSCRFSIWDYKTGRIYKKYRDADPFAQGRLVQHALYMTMAEGMLGLSGLTVTCRVVGEITRSMSSMGIAPRRTRSPSTSAPP